MPENKKYARKKDIFISYRRDGADVFAKQVQQSLGQKGYSVFLDVESIRPGTQFNEKLYEVIDGCKDFILILPKGGLERCNNEDDWVRLEIERARKKGKNIIPVRLRNFEMPEELPASLEFLRNQHSMAPTTEYYEAFIDKLAGSLISRPKPRPKWWLFALAAIILGVTGFFCYDHFSKYPHNNQQDQLVSRLITYLVLNMQNYDSANKIFVDGINETEKYVEGKSKTDQEGIRKLLMNQKEKISSYTVNDFPDPGALVNSPFDAADIEAFPAYLQNTYGILADLMDRVDQWVGAGWKDDRFIDYMELLKEYAGLELEVLFYSTNETLLPVTNESALEKLKTEFLPRLTSMRHMTLLKDPKVIEGKIEAAISRQEEIMYTDVPGLFAELEKDLTRTGIENRLGFIRKMKETYADDPEILEELAPLEEQANRMLAQIDTISDRSVEIDKLDTRLAAAKNRLYVKHMPLSTDDQEILWLKGIIFLSFDMNSEAKECFEMFAKKGDQSERKGASSAIKFADFRTDLPEVEGGVIVFGYEEGTEHQDVEIGDIIYAMDGQPVLNYSDYVNKRSEGEEHTLDILRFGDTGYDLLTAGYDPGKGRLYLYSLMYESE